MLKRFLVVLLAATMPLAACNRGPSVHAENATAGEVAKKVEAAGGASFVNPGKWVTNATIEDMSMPGMPPQAATQMKGMMGRVHTSQSCLTPEDVKRPKENFFAGAEENCRYEHFTMGGGKIDAAMACTRQGGTQTMQMAGTYSSDSYAMVMTTTASGAGPASGMKMRVRMEAKRVGACDGTEGKN